MSVEVVGVEEALVTLDTALQPGGLNNMQELVFRQAWKGQTYFEVAHSFGYDSDYVKDVGSKLWQLLSETFGEKVTKSNFQSVLRRRSQGVSLEKSQWLPTPTTQPVEHISANQTRATPQLENLESMTANKHQDWGEALDVSIFYGRSVELAMLEQWITRDNCRLVALFGMGGIGKTALAVKLAEKIQDEFDFLIWRSLRNAPPFGEVLTDLVRFLTPATDLPETVDAKMSQLIDYLRQHRCLLVLDNFESILGSGATLEASQNYRAGHYQARYEGYGQLLRRVSEANHQSCLVLTSREKPVGLSSKEGRTLPVRSLQLRGLDLEEGQKILVAAGLSSSPEEQRALIESYMGNPLALRIVSTTIQDLFNGSICQFLEQGTLVFGDIRDLLAQQFNRLSIIEKRVIHWLATEYQWAPLLKLPESASPVSQWELLEALESLQRRSLIESNLVHFAQQPAVLEYLTNQLIEQVQTETGTDKNLEVNSPNRSQVLAEHYSQEQASMLPKLITQQLLTASKRKSGIST